MLTSEINPDIAAFRKYHLISCESSIQSFQIQHTQKIRRYSQLTTNYVVLSMLHAKDACVLMVHSNNSNRLHHRS